MTMENPLQTAQPPLDDVKPPKNGPGRRTLIQGEKKVWLDSTEHWDQWHAAGLAKGKGGVGKARGCVYDMLVASMIARYGWHEYDADVPVLATPPDADDNDNLDEEVLEERIKLKARTRKVCHPAHHL
jgi:hypothetical protein